MIIDPAPDPVRPRPPISIAPDDIAREHAALLSCLKRIAKAHPTCGDSATAAFVNRVWAGHFRDIQRDARMTLKELGHDL